MKEEDKEISDLSPAESLKWYFLEADKGDPRAKRELGRMYSFGFSHPDDLSVEILPDAAKARRWLSEAADDGDGKAALLLGQLLDGETTQGPFDEPKEAFRRYQQAVDLGCREARFHLGTRYLVGRGTRRNDRRGREVLIEAAYAGDTDAQSMMAQIYAKDGNEVASAAWIIVASLFGSEYHEDQKGRRVPIDTPELARQIIQKVNIYSALVECDTPVLIEAADLIRSSISSEI